MHALFKAGALRLVGSSSSRVASGAMAHASHDDVILIISARTCAHGGWMMSDVHLTRACTARPVRVALLSSLNK